MMDSPVQVLPTYGRDLIAGIDPAIAADCVLLCAPEPWELVRERFPGEPRAVAVPQSMEQARIEAQLDSLPPSAAVIGLGGGSACDAAKLHAWRSGARLLLIPSILSVDAPFTRAIGVRVDGRVRYIGDALPEQLLIDFDLLQRAAPRLNRGGVGDLLSIHTALWDWKLAHRELGEAYDAEIAAASQALFERMVAGADAIRECSEAGLRLLCELYVAEVALCERFGNSRPEEGSEHYLAYCLESLTGKAYLHGELIALCVLLTAQCQEQPIVPLRALLRTLGVAHDPASVGVSHDELEQALLRLPSYLQEETQLPYGVYHHRGMNAERAAALVATLEDTP